MDSFNPNRFEPPECRHENVEYDPHTGRWRCTKCRLDQGREVPTAAQYRNRFAKVTGTGATGPDPLDTQVGGGHYKGKAIQPVEYISANGLNFLEGCIVKRITRWREKPADKRFEDLEKIKHEVDLLIAMETKYAGRS